MTAPSPFGALKDRFEARLRRPPPLYGRSRALIAAMEADPEVRRRESVRLSADLLARVRRTPWGRAHAGATTLGDLALLTKAELRARPGDFLGRSLGPTLTSQTSGTTGAALGVVRSLSSVAFEQATLDWLVAQAGLDLRHARMAVFRAADLKAGPDGRLWTASADGLRLVFSSNDLGPKSFPAIAAALAAFQPEILYGYPSALATLARFYADSPLRLAVPLALTSSETFAAIERARVAETFKARSIDYYGQAERAAFAYSLTPGDYRFLPSYGEVELLPEAHAEGAYEIVGSAFHNAAQLLPRYCTGDSVLLRSGADSMRVARGEEPFEGVIGRVNDVIRGPGGEVFIGLNHIPRGLGRFERLQLVQTAPDHVRILVIGVDRLEPADVAAVLARARLKIPEVVRLDVEAADAPLRTASGKAPLVISQVAPDAASAEPGA